MGQILSIFNWKLHSESVISRKDERFWQFPPPPGELVGREGWEPGLQGKSQRGRENKWSDSLQRGSKAQPAEKSTSQIMKSETDRISQ